MYCPDLQPEREWKSFMGYVFFSLEYNDHAGLWYVDAWGPWGRQCIIVVQTKKGSQAQFTKRGEINYRTVMKLSSVFVKREK